MELRYFSNVLIIILLSASCGKPSDLRPKGVFQNSNSATAREGVVSTTASENMFSKEPSLSYQDYVVTKLYKRVNVGSVSTEVSYAALKKGQKVMATFDGLYHPAGNTTQFGFFGFLGGDSKQLAVEQAIPRNWRHWIVSLSPRVHVIFDSTEFEVDGELVALDVNNDGVYEFTKTIVAFYDFENLPSSESPLVEMLFKYDEKSAKYLPANHVFPEFALKGIEEEIRNVYGGDNTKNLSKVLHVVLRYIYAGKALAGWAFYDKVYQLPNRDQIKSEVLIKLTNEPIYKFIYKRS